MEEISHFKKRAFEYLATQSHVDLGVRASGSHYFDIDLISGLVHDSYFDANSIEVNKGTVKIRIDRERMELCHKMSDLPVVKSDLIFNGVVKSRLILENIAFSKYCDDYRFWIFSVDLIAHEIEQKRKLKVILGGNGWQMVLELKWIENCVHLRDCK